MKSDDKSKLDSIVSNLKRNVSEAQRLRAYFEGKNEFKQGAFYHGQYLAYRAIMEEFGKSFECYRGATVRPVTENQMELFGNTAIMKGGAR